MLTAISSNTCAFSIPHWPPAANTAFRTPAPEHTVCTLRKGAQLVGRASPWLNWGCQAPQKLWQEGVSKGKEGSWRKKPSAYQHRNLGGCLCQRWRPPFSNSQASRRLEAVLILRVTAPTANISNMFNGVLRMGVNSNIVRSGSVRRKCWGKLGCGELRKCSRRQSGCRYLRALLEAIFPQESY